jgi:hypothetical protein
MANSGRLYQGVFQPHMLLNALSHDLHRPVLYTDGGTLLRASDLCDLASCYCQAFASLGLKAGTRVGLLAGNRAEVLHVTHACMFSLLRSASTAMSGACTSSLGVECPQKPGVSASRQRWRPSNLLWKN